MFPNASPGRLLPQFVRTALVLIVCCGTPRAASADWLLTPFLGVKFRGDTSLFDPEAGAEKASTAIGGSVMLVGNGILGLEGDFAYLPGFFGSKSFLVDSSRVFTLTGNVIITTPTQITRESLRPFVAAGIGLMAARFRGQGERALVGKMDELALGVGVGALGALSDDVSVRFEVRRFQNLTEHDATGIAFGRTRLRFWRADVGLAFRY